MTTKQFYVTGLSLTAAILFATVAVYPQLPEEIPRYWGNAEIVRVHTPKSDLFLSGPGLMLGMLLLAWILPRLPWKRSGLHPQGETSSIFYVIQLGILGLPAYIHILILVGALGDPIDMAQAVGLGLSMFLLLMGNVMGKVRRNACLGIRTRWTLSNERIWNATNRLAGKTIFSAGILGLVFYAWGAAILAMLFWVAFAAAFAIPSVYSRRLAKRLEQQGQI